MRVLSAGAGVPGFLAISLLAAVVLPSCAEPQDGSSLESQTSNDALGLRRRDYNPLYFYLYGDQEVFARRDLAKKHGAILRIDAYFDGQCLFNANLPENDQNPSRAYWRYAEPRVDPGCSDSRFYSERAFFDALPAVSAWISSFEGKPLKPIDLLITFLLEGGHLIFRDTKSDIAHGVVHGRVNNAVGGSAPANPVYVQRDPSGILARLGAARLQGISTQHHMGIDQLFEVRNEACSGNDLCFQAANDPSKYLWPKSNARPYLNHSSLSQSGFSRFFPAGWQSGITAVAGYQTQSGTARAVPANTIVGLTEAQALVFLAATFKYHVASAPSGGSDPERIDQYYRRYNGGPANSAPTPNSGLARGLAGYILDLCRLGKGVDAAVCTGGMSAPRRTASEAVAAFGRLWEGGAAPPVLDGESLEDAGQAQPPVSANPVSGSASPGPVASTGARPQEGGWRFTLTCAQLGNGEAQGVEQFGTSRCGNSRSGMVTPEASAGVWCGDGGRSNWEVMLTCERGNVTAVTVSAGWEGHWRIVGSDWNGPVGWGAVRAQRLQNPRPTVQVDLK